MEIEAVRFTPEGGHQRADARRSFVP